MFCGKGAKSDLHSGRDRSDLQDFFSVYISNDEKWFLYLHYSPRTHMHALTHTPPLLNSYPSYKFPQLKQLNVAGFHVAVKS